MAKTKTPAKDGNAAKDGDAAQPKPKQPPAKRKRAPPVTTASTLQAKTLYASTRDEVREIQTELEENAEERRQLLEADGSGVKAILSLLPVAEKK